MGEYEFINNEEKLFDVIRSSWSTIEEYEQIIGRVQNINYTDCNDRSFLHEAVIYKKNSIVCDLLNRGIVLTYKM